MNNESITSVPVQRKKSSWLVMVIIIILVLGVVFGLFLAKDELFKKDTKDNKTLDEEVVQEEKKIKPNSNLKLLKELTDTITLNEKNINYLAYYYENKNSGISKEVYLNDNKVIELYDVKYDKTDDVSNVIEEDNKKTFASFGYLDDKENKNKYLIYYYDFEYILGTNNEKVDTARNVLVIDDDGKVLFSGAYRNPQIYKYLKVDSKEEALDRVTTERVFGSYDPYIVVYAGDDDSIEASLVEFKKDHFYSLQTSINCETLDYKYEIINGELKQTLLKKYNQGDPHIQGTATC